MTIFIECDACGSSYKLNGAVLGEAKGARVRCRKCGGSIHVVNPNATQAGEAKAMDEAVEKEKKGWVSPTYNVSRAVTLDPDTLADNRCVAFQPDGCEIEPYRVLRTRILHRAKEGRGTIVMVTSALPGEGKTLTTVNLALTFARSYGQTALLVDADLRQQKIHSVLGYESDIGLADFLLDGCAVSDLFVWPGIEKLTVISGGRTIDESSELIGSPGMKLIIEEMRNRYPERYVFIDSPPVLSGADAIALAPLVDYIVMVVQAEKTSGANIRMALELLPKDKILGLVLNRDRSPEGVPYYYYSRYPQKAPSKPGRS